MLHRHFYVSFFFFNDTATTEIYTLSLHDALPILGDPRLVSLIRRWLKAGVLEDGEVHASEQGTPQGGSISVLLSNVYLRSEEHTSELQSRLHLVCRLLLEKKKKKQTYVMRVLKQD